MYTVFLDTCDKCLLQCDPREEGCSSKGNRTVTCLEGVCRIKDGRATCECSLGYQAKDVNLSGDTDSSTYQQCELLCNDYCANHGFCSVDDKGNAVCKCNPRYSGDKCEYDKCTQCKNGGKMIVRNSSLTCSYTIIFYYGKTWFPMINTLFIFITFMFCNNSLTFI